MTNKIKDVNFEFYSDDKSRIQRCRAIKKYIAQSAAFQDMSGNEAPWLVAEEAFAIDPVLKHKLFKLGQAVYLFFDALQLIYQKDKNLISALLDIGVSEELLGFGLEGSLCNYRLDLVLENNEPKIAEVEEVYGLSGMLYYAKDAYHLNYDAMFRLYNQLNLDYLFVDDALATYADFRTLVDALNQQFGSHIQLLPFSALESDMRGNARRLCYVKDFNQYSMDHRKKIMASQLNFINPLFHGYGTKTALILPFVDKIKPVLIQLMGKDMYETLVNGLPKADLLTNQNKDLIQSLLENKKNKLLKVMDCPSAPEYTWGSRGLYFGASYLKSGKKHWQKIIEQALRGEIPQNPTVKNTTYAVIDLIESDKFKVPFLDEYNQQISLMPNARIRLSPIYFRIDGVVSMPGGFATFVNNGRKVHCGTHSVVAPIQFN